MDPATTPDAQPAEPDGPPDASAVALSVVDGVLRVHSEPGATTAARLSWTNPALEVKHLGTRVAGGMSCVVAPGNEVTARVPDVEARCEYVVTVSPDKMHARLRVRLQSGRSRQLADAAPTGVLRLSVLELPLDPSDPVLDDAANALLDAGVTWGIDDAAVEAAVAAPGSEHVVAQGREAVPGRNGYVQPLIDFEAVRTTGVPAETPLLRRVRKRDGQPGRTVTGKDLAVRPVRDVRVKLGAGVATDELDLLALSTYDGLPWWDGDAFIEVREELVLDAVDTGTGDIDFRGSVHVTGNVQEGRLVRAAHRLLVDGNVDRARLESGDSMEVNGAIMSSVLRAGGERAVAASILDRVMHFPTQLAEAATRARELRDAAEARGTELSHGLSLQLVLERMYRPALNDLLDAANDLLESGPEHAPLADEFHQWHRKLATAANESMGAEDFIHILDDSSRRVEGLRRAVEHHADLSLNYMQASEAEATGRVTLTGKGIFNSSITAWGGLIASDPRAVVRGGSIVSHGPVQIAEIGSPGGSTMRVQLGGNKASLDADLVYAGMLVAAKGHAHRFIADRTHVKIRFDDTGMNVESLAA